MSNRYQGSDMLSQIIPVFVACTAVKNYVLQTFCRGVIGPFYQPEPVAPLTGVHASIDTLATLAIFWLDHFF